ncbi:metallophosphoesterase [Microbacterium azadirachtae]|uniref:metallophosphoesterase n=1 Tax=Microbacterium azadirachtae TaxID=582680 RepID=UPI000890D2D9|nr:metallophosphoesterase [Microbacterium azadirachtae]SDL43515.1 Calcineurin-like phosphoesterase [Microbacterium azadirachtae]SEF73945.1 Calcineurin-like phosphoesterase [Microbacterium azadirachtae]SEF74643.1 Calcineurin-like phosphoesterase [Microbacterium azadirachtae]
MTVQFGRYAPPTHTLVHLSDPHLLAGGAALGGRFDVDRTLARTLAVIENAVERPDAIVVTGDLADLGEPDAYRRLRAAVAPVSERLGAPVIWVAGNHDERAVLREHLLDAPPTEDPVTGVWDLRGLRVIALDSTVPGWHHGDVDAEQRAWLAEQLSEPAPHGTLLAMHHPPVPSHIPFFDILELRHQDELAEILRGSDVRGILAGHLHYSLHATFAGIPVSVASATCYTMDVASPGDQVNGMDAAQSFQLVHVRPETIAHTVVPVVEAIPVDTFSPEWVARMERLTPEERLEAFSRKPGR